MTVFNSLHGAFETAADVYADRIALRYGEKVLTYKQLDRLANTIGNMLREKLDNIDEAAVAILVNNHSMLRYVYMLGVLKAGYTYVPLDAKAISERSNRILSISGAKILLTENDFEDFAKNVINIGTLKSEEIIFCSLDEIEETNRNSAETDGERSAYVIFTSGSTGEPKGVEVQDKAVLNFISSVVDKLDITCEDKTVSLSNFSFDASVFDMYPFLMMGGEIVLISENERQSVTSLNNYMIENGITIQCMTTALYHLMLNEENPVLKKLCVIGEKMLAYKDKTYDIYNMYGPTEATCLVTLCRINKDEDDIPVGYPLDNVKIGIINDMMEELPSGEKGQIVIGGICLAKCYRNNPEETNKRFIRLSNGEMIYLTGDIGSLDNDGNLHCYGRMDNQVKYKGYRIELDEIRKVFLQNDNISDAVILLITEEHGSYLAAAVCSKGEISEEELRKYLERELPDYMIPQKIRFMDDFPLNRNKKIDTKAIKELIRSEYISDAPYGDESIHDICKKMWSEILCISYEEVVDNVPFKELGGDSLQMLTMISEIGKQFNIRIPFEDFITDPTLSNITQIIENLSVGE